MPRVLRHPNGPRLYLANQRVHHGAAGCALVALGLALHRRALVVLGAALVADDRRDWRAFFTREGYPQ